IADALPSLLVVPGIVLLARRRTVRQRLGRGAVVVVQRRAWGLGLVLCVLGVTAVVRGWPFTSDGLGTARDLGAAPYQALIDRVDALGGVTVWSLPEARDIGEQQVGPVRVSWLTEPYADDLLRTFRHTAFGAVSVGMGETLQAPAGTPVEVRIAVDASDGGRHDVRVSLIRNGRIEALERGATPHRSVRREIADGTPLVLRVEARAAQAQRVLSNPIFVKP